MTPQSPSKQAPWDLTQFSQLSPVAPSYFPEFHQWSEISFLSKVILVLGKARSHRALNLGYRGLNHLGDLMFHQKLRMTRDAWEARCHDEAAIHQLVIAAAFWIIWVVSMEECSRLTQNPMQICYSTSSVILKVMATQYTCSLNGIYHPHWLVQWSHHCSHMHSPGHCPWLSGYINVIQTILIILTMAGLFQDRHHTCSSIHILYTWSHDPYFFLYCKGQAENFPHFTDEVKRLDGLTKAV